MTTTEPTTLTNCLAEQHEHYDDKREKLFMISSKHYSQYL
jgi:hypothetical protein